LISNCGDDSRRRLILLSRPSFREIYIGHFGMTGYPLRHPKLDQVTVFVNRASIFVSLGVI
jgi:hypothetical protein